MENLTIFLENESTDKKNAGNIKKKDKFLRKLYKKWKKHNALKKTLKVSRFYKLESSFKTSFKIEKKLIKLQKKDQSFNI